MWGLDFFFFFFFFLFFPARPAYPTTRRPGGTHATGAVWRTNAPSFHSPLYRLTRQMRLLLVAVAVLLVLGVARAALPGYGRSFDSFEELRNTRPSATGEVVYLTSHVAGLYQGGGQFVGTLASGTNDYGMIASNGTAFHWDRMIDDLETLNVLHFGAYHDGIHDDHDAVVNMINWSNKQSGNLPRNGVRFVQGSILISPIDLTATYRAVFAIFGPTAPSAQGPFTTILSDGSDAPVFNVSARWMTIRGVAWDGRATATVGSDYVPKDVSNAQPFFQNIVTAGEYFNAESFYATRTGGTVFSLLDTLDTRFVNIETYNTYSNLWNISWSNDPTGNWDHATAVEADNIYITNSYGDLMLNATRMAQGLLRNIYIKHCLNPGNFENSQWVIDNFYVEDCKQSFGFLSNRDITHNIEIVNASITRGSSSKQWLSSYEMGYLQANNYGMTVRSTISRTWKASLIRGSNNAASPLWVEVGTFNTQTAGGLWKIDVLSRVNYRVANYTRPTSNGSGGRTAIMLQRGADETPVVTYSSQGYAAVTDVLYKGITANQSSIWVRIAPYCGEYSFFIRSTGTFRLNTTVTNFNLFIKSGATSLSAPSGYSLAANKASLHNGAAGFGAERGVLTIDTTVNVTLVPGALAGHTMTKVNGVNIATPYYHITPAITSSPTLTTTVAAGNKFTLSVTASYAVSYQWQYGTATSLADISGANSSTYSVTASSSSDSGKYRVLAIGSEGRDTAAVSRIVTVTVS